MKAILTNVGGERALKGKLRLPGNRRGEVAKTLRSAGQEEQTVLTEAGRETMEEDQLQQEL